MPTDLRPVKSFEKAVQALGGTTKAAEAISTKARKRPAGDVCKWRTRHGAFPADLYFKVQRALERKGYWATPKVFTFELR